MLSIKLRAGSLGSHRQGALGFLVSLLYILKLACSGNHIYMLSMTRLWEWSEAERVFMNEVM